MYRGEPVTVTAAHTDDPAGPYYTVTLRSGGVRDVDELEEPTPEAMARAMEQMRRELESMQVAAGSPPGVLTAPFGGEAMALGSGDACMGGETPLNTERHPGGGLPLGGEMASGSEQVAPSAFSFLAGDGGGGGVREGGGGALSADLFSSSVNGAAAGVGGGALSAELFGGGDDGGGGGALMGVVEPEPAVGEHARGGEANGSAFAFMSG